MSFASLRKVLRSARKGLCSTCSKAKFPQLEAAGAGHVGCLIYTFETLGQLVKDDHDVTCMHVAARKGHISILIYIIENNLSDTIPRAKNGATPAHDAAGTGNLECLRYLLSHTKAKASDIDQNNATPLHWAVQSGHLKVVQWLVMEMHAFIDAVAKNGVTPIHVAAARNYVEILKWVTGYAYKNHPKPRRLINAKDKNGATPMYHAAHAGHTGIIRWLAEKGGGDPTIISNQGLAPLHAATIAGNVEAVKYLFQFGLATAPGGLRTTEGACALHFAAAEGHVQIAKWLVQQKECSGNERDYYQSTPLHDAAEHGHIKILQLLCEDGANCTLTDVEGNLPQDLADKNGQNKCAKFLASFVKNKKANGAAGEGRKLSRGISRNKHSKAEMIDSYRNAPPHQLPVNVFEGDDDEEMDTNSGDEQWTTLRDLMGEKEMQQLGEVPVAVTENMSEEEKKRWKLEEDMRKEKEERRQKRRALLQREEEYEKEIREGLLAEEIETPAKKPPSASTKVKKRKKSDPTKPSALSQLKRLSLPVKLGTDAELTQRGLVEKRTQEFELRTPKGKKSFLKLLSRKSAPPISTLAESKSWDSHLKALSTANPYEEEHEYYFADEEDLPEPPPIPTVEYLLGKRPVNLRKRASQILMQQIQEKINVLGNDSDDSDDHSSVGSSKSDKKHRRRKSSKRKKKKSAKDANDVVNDWKYNNMPGPQSSPQRGRKDRERHPTPIPPQPKSYFLDDKMPMILLDFDAVFDDVEKELSKVQSSLLSEEDSPSSLSPLHSPSPKSPLSPPGSTEASPLHSATVSASGKLKQASKKGDTAPVQKRIPKRPAPKLPAHLKLKSKQDLQITGAAEKQPAVSKQNKPSPISKIMSARGKSNQPQKQPQNDRQVAKSPTDFMAALKQAISSSPPQPRILRQHGMVETSSSNPGTHSPTMEEIEDEIEKMTSLLSHPLKGTQQRPPSPELAAKEESDTETDSSDYTSSSEDSTSSDSDDSSSEDSSESDEEIKRPIARPIMARNIGMSGGARARVMGFNRVRMLSRYPRLFRRRIIKLDTIMEQPEEKLHEAKTVEEKAIIFYRIVKQRKAMKAWRKYMQIMRSAYRKAEKMAVRKRRDVLAKAFYVWIQVRNMAAVDKDEMGRSEIFYKKQLMKKVFDAWLFSRLGTKMPIARSASMQLVTAEDTYLDWLNKHLAYTGRHVDDISESLRDGVLIIKAIANASGQKPPKFNAHPKVRLHCQDNWKMAHEFMKIVGINMKGIEPADLANVLPAAIHNMFNNVLKWYEK